MYEVLISYSSKDKQWADAACSILEQYGIRCWIAPRDIVPGTEWGAAIIAAIDACEAMVLIFSSSANASPQVRREVEDAISKGLIIVPCRIENVQPQGAMEFALMNTHWLDAFTPPVERQLEQLAESVEALLPPHRRSPPSTRPRPVPVLPDRNSLGGWFGRVASRFFPATGPVTGRKRRRIAAAGLACSLLVASLLTYVFWPSKNGTAKQRTAGFHATGSNSPGSKSNNISSRGIAATSAGTLKRSSTVRQRGPAATNVEEGANATGPENSTDHDAVAERSGHEPFARESSSHDRNTGAGRSGSSSRFGSNRGTGAEANRIGANGVGAGRSVAAGNNVESGVRDDNGLKLKLIRIAPGQFQMLVGAGKFVQPSQERAGRRGTNRNGKRSHSPEAEHPLVEGMVDVFVTNEFWLGKDEVTQGQWRQVMQTTPWQGQNHVQEGDNDPATFVSWNGAVEFCRKLTDAERTAGRLSADRAYTLPTEAQWEYACRAGTETLFSFGSGFRQLPRYAWFGPSAYNGQSVRGQSRPWHSTPPDEAHAHPCGLKMANPWGLCDMHGNVYEWCRDQFTDNVPGGNDPEVQLDGASRVIRGGAWNTAALGCTSSARDSNPPTAARDDLGFRVALVVTRRATDPTLDSRTAGQTPEARPADSTRADGPKPDSPKADVAAINSGPGKGPSTSPATPATKSPAGSPSPPEKK